MAKQKKLTPAERRALERSDERLMHLYPPCMYCKHRTDIGTQESLRGWTCAAFPEEIPYDILARIKKHDTPLPGQVGQFVYESQLYEFYDGPCVVSFEGEWRKVRRKKKPDAR